MKAFCLFLSLALLAVIGPSTAAELSAVALDGLDPLTVIEGAPRRGDEQLASVHGRFRYLFVSADNKAKFDGDPGRWAIQLDGSCAMMPGAFTDGSIYAVERGRLFAFGSPHCKAEFLKDPDRYIAAAAKMDSVAILIFDGVQIIDYSGPYEVFGQAGFRVFTVAASAEPITTNMGMKVTPSYTLDNAPEARVVVVPGGGVDSSAKDPRILGWLRESAAKAEHLLTVCNGAFILAGTGLLDGLTATTFYDLIPELREVAPKTRVVSDQRFVDNGKIITTAGLSSGIDGSLHVVERLRGKGKAQQVALNMEYDWRPDTPYARAGLADAELRRLFGRGLGLELPDGGEFKVLSTEGTKDRWEVNWELKTGTALPDLQAALVAHLTKAGGWTPRGTSPIGGSRQEWRYTDADRQPWNATVDLRPMEGKSGEYSMAIRVDRAGG
ncbi:MAG TPA: DJ-1/PfpI family protein [Thermoanaerobaculia bacterium]|nr:DJ-1/PfpI family protein [Thermoanaerobaculia bacterium]